MELREILLNIIMFCVVLIILIVATVIILNQFSPFKECETKDNNYMVQLGKEWFTCGELRTVNWTEGVSK